MNPPSTPITPDLARLRIEYQQRSLSETDVVDDPLQQFLLWLNEAIAAEAREPNAFTLATCSRDGFPSARIVLLKGIEAGALTFFTNYQSRKGLELEANPRAAMVFFWAELERQVRVEGTVARSSPEASAAYFASRPPAARIGSAASPQSQPIAARQVLVERERLLWEQFPTGDIPCPAHWGGFRITPNRMEFWQGRPSRLHDRIEYLLGEPGTWTRRRLAP